MLYVLKGSDGKKNTPKIILYALLVRLDGRIRECRKTMFLWFEFVFT
jgi:hypothetical protein